MPLMKLACTALERVPVTRPKVIENLMQKFNQDLVFCRAPMDNDVTKDLRGAYCTCTALAMATFYFQNLFDGNIHLLIFRTAGGEIWSSN